MVCWALWGVLAVINVAGYFLIRADKKAARVNRRRAQGRRRVPERTFHLIAALGGWPGLLLAMGQVRHKTQKRRFKLILGLAAIVSLLGWTGWLVVFECLPVPAGLAA